jgi:hypothetical protein
MQEANRTPLNLGGLMLFCGAVLKAGKLLKYNKKQMGTVMKTDENAIFIFFTYKFSFSKSSTKNLMIGHIINTMPGIKYKNTEQKFITLSVPWSNVQSLNILNIPIGIAEIIKTNIKAPNMIIGEAIRNMTSQLSNILTLLCSYSLNFLIGFLEKEKIMAGINEIYKGDLNIQKSNRLFLKNPIYFQNQS